MDQDALYIDIGRANYTRKELLVEEADEAGAGEGEGDEEGGEAVRALGWGGVRRKAVDVEAGGDEF